MRSLHVLSWLLRELHQISCWYTAYKTSEMIRQAPPSPPRYKNIKVCRRLILAVSGIPTKRSRLDVGCWFSHIGGEKESVCVAFSAVCEWFPFRGRLVTQLPVSNNPLVECFRSGVSAVSEIPLKGTPDIRCKSDPATYTREPGFWRGVRCVTRVLRFIPWCRWVVEAVVAMWWWRTVFLTTCLVAWGSALGQELKATRCSITDFACGSPEDKCIPKYWKCDGTKDCLDGSDEDPDMCPGEYCPRHHSSMTPLDE